MSDEFSWNDRHTLVLPEQRAVAAYRNDDGDIVIRQERGWEQEEDDILVLTSRAATEALIHRLGSLLDGGAADE